MANAALDRPSMRLILSYVFDWIIILAMAAVGAAWNAITPYKRPISLVDLSISFPYKEHETVPFWVCAVVSLVAPGVIILVVSLFLIPGPTVKTQQSKRQMWQRRLWEWNTGWMGLGLSLAAAFLVTQGLKNLTGKARPDLLARCMPDLDNLERYVVGNGYGQSLNERWVRFSAAICQNQDKSVLNDGFRSWPSGHSSFAWSGLLYLTLFLCSKFAIAIPFLAPHSYTQDIRSTFDNDEPAPALPLYKPRLTGTDQTLDGPTTDSSATTTASPVPYRNQAAAPPNYLLILALIPVATATYIATTRYTDFRHQGIDILSGSLIGIVAAVFAFRWYHLPIRRGAGWAWGARSRDRAFGIGVGVGSYVGTEGWGSGKRGKGKGGLDKVRDETEEGPSVRASDVGRDVERAAE